MNADPQLSHFHRFILKNTNFWCKMIYMKSAVTEKAKLMVIIRASNICATQESNIK